jgi:glucosamine--fructose-6-phosphate aminotransferase (isomerizing)
LKLVTGSFAIAVISRREPQKLVGARSGSPLIVGSEGREFSCFRCPGDFSAYQRNNFSGGNEVAVLNKGGVRKTDLDGKLLVKKSQRLLWDIEQAQKMGYKHFMLKEINEQPEIIENLINLRMSKEGRIVFKEQHIGAEKLKRSRIFLW